VFLQRLIHLACLTGAGIAPVITAFSCHFLARIATQHILPLATREPLPSLTKTWIVGVANGDFPLMFIAIGVSILFAGTGLFVLFSNRVSADVKAVALPAIYCIAYSLAVAMFGTSMMALVIPFVPNASE
jgi:hypothetical protein